MELDDVDLALVDLICRLQLLVKRAGGTLSVEEPSPQLVELLERAGLADVVRSALQPGREAEGGEQLGVEKVVEP